MLRVLLLSQIHGRPGALYEITLRYHMNQIHYMKLLSNISQINLKADIKKILEFTLGDFFLQIFELKKKFTLLREASPLQVCVRGEGDREGVGEGGPGRGEYRDYLTTHQLLLVSA